MKFFKNPWSWVLIMFVVVSWGGTFIQRPLEIFDGFVLSKIPSNNERVLSAMRLFNILILPLAITYLIADYVLKSKKKSYRN